MFTYKEPHDIFVKRHIGIDDSDLKAVLQTINVASIDELINKTVPPAIHLQNNLK